MRKILLTALLLGALMAALCLAPPPPDLVRAVQIPHAALI